MDALPYVVTVHKLCSDQWDKKNNCWQEFHRRSPSDSSTGVAGATFFLSNLWVEAWMRVYGTELHPQLLQVGNSTDTVGYAILSHNQSRKGPFTWREVYLNTTGERPDSPMLEHNHLLCDAKHQSETGAALVQHLKLQDWDEFKLNGIDKATYTTISDLMGAPTKEIWRDSPYVDLDTLRLGSDEFLSSLSKNTRSKIRRSLKLYGESGDVVMRYAENQDQAKAFFGELVDVHQKNWQAKGQGGAFATARLKAFHQHIIEHGSPGQDYQLIHFSCAGDTVGVIYNLVHEGHISYYQSGFVYQNDNRFKPGLTCHALAIQKALEDGFREYDFLANAGVDSQYKSSLSNASRQLGWITYQQPSTKLTVIKTLQRILRRQDSQ